jgi:nucleoside-diphosphate-sugar epimerase
VKVLVTGAAGLLGKQLVSALQARGDGVRALVLPTDDIAWLKQRGVDVCVGDIRIPDTLVPAMRGIDGVLHLAAMHGLWRPMKDYYAVNVVGTENVCRAAVAARVRRLVHISSYMVYGLGLDRPADENSPLAPFPEPYAMSKVEGEKVVRQFIARDHLPAVIIRPGTIIGPGDRLHVVKLCDRLRAGRIVVIGSGHNAVPFVYVTDVVQGLLLALDKERAVGQTYNIANDQPLTQEEIYTTLAEGIGVKPPRLHVPYWPLRALAFVAEGAAVLTNSRRPPLVTRMGIRVFATDNRHAIDKARAELGYNPQVSVREGLRLSAEWYRRWWDECECRC